MMSNFKLVGDVGGFPEYLPKQQRGFDLAMERIKSVYESFGYTPLETAGVERVETLISKGISAKEVYGLRRLNAEDGDDGAKDVALRFDLTVPMARYVSQNWGELVFPFRRYQTQPVWRGERPQNGRYRQFYQCDVDIIGDGALSLSADAEVLAVAVTALDKLEVGGFTLRVNNRKLLEGIIRWSGATDGAAAMKLIDDAEKVGWEKTEKLLQEKAGIDANKAAKLVAVLRETDALAAVPANELDEAGKVGFDELKSVLEMAKGMLPPALQNVLKADLSIARGLDYYTGTVVETRLHAAPELGSICSGGRYENLTASLGKKVLPGVGLSIGLSRLLAWLLSQEPYASLGATPARVFIACQDEALRGYYSEVARTLRGAGWSVEQHTGGQALGTQLKNADKRGIEWAVLANADDAAAGKLQVKNLYSGEQQTIDKNDILSFFEKCTKN